MLLNCCSSPLHSLLWPCSFLSPPGGLDSWLGSMPACSSLGHTVKVSLRACGVFILLSTRSCYRKCQGHTVDPGDPVGAATEARGRVTAKLRPDECTPKKQWLRDLRKGRHWLESVNDDSGPHLSVHSAGGNFSILMTWLCSWD